MCITGFYIDFISHNTLENISTEIINIRIVFTSALKNLKLNFKKSKLLKYFLYLTLT